MTDSYKQHIAESALIALVCTFVSYAVGLVFGWVPHSSINWLEVFAVFTSYACTWLCVRERRSNYPLGMVSSAAYAVLFWQSGLVASAALNAYLVPALIYGWIRWRPDQDTRPITHITAKMVPVYLLFTLSAYLGAVLLAHALGGTLVWTDSVILVLTIFSQFLLDNKKLQNWFGWMVVNVFAAWTYAHAHLPLVTFQYVLFLINTFVGFYVWNTVMKRQIIPGSKRVPKGDVTYGPCS